MSDLPSSDETEREDDSRAGAEGATGRGAGQEPPGPVDDELIDPPDR